MANLLRLRGELCLPARPILQPLRDSEFLAAIKHRSAIPGGTCEFDLPDFFFWLNQAADVARAHVQRWLAMLRPLCDAIAELLWLTRQNGRTREEIAQGGCSTSPSNATRRSNCCASRCLPRPACTRRSAAATTAAAFAS